MIFDQFDMSVRMASILQEEALRLLPRMRARESEAVLRGDSASAITLANAIYWIEQALGGPARSSIPSGPHIVGDGPVARGRSATKPDAKPGLKECMAAINRARHRGLDWEFCARSPKVGLQLNIEEIEALGAYYVARERDGATGEGDCK